MDKQVALIRMTAVARVLGIAPRLSITWARKAGVEPFAAPVVRGAATPRIGTGTGPLYVTMRDAVTLLQAILPKAVDARERERARAALRREAERTQASDGVVRQRAIGLGG